ncbi:MAG: hypothetical protein V4538_15605 [Bacteroidota bacterium]
MAEKPIQSNEVIDPAFLVEALAKANELVSVFKELRKVSEDNLKVSRDAISVVKFNNSKDLKDEIVLRQAVNKEILQLNAIKKSEITVEAERSKLRNIANKELSQQLKTEAEFAKALQNEGKSVNQLTSVYDVLRKKYNDLSRSQIELAVRGRESGKVFRGIKDEAAALRLELDKAEQGAGRFQRNVGNYKSGFDGLGNSVNQLTREFPAFAVSAQTGFLAISNNLPIFFDQIQKIREANEALVAEGKQGVSVLKQLGSAVFSVGSILSIGVTLLTLYGKEIVEWTVALFKGDEALKSITEANNSFNKSINATREEINNLKVDLKVQMGLLTKLQGDQIKNEGARNKELKGAETLRREKLKALREELKLSKDLTYSNTTLQLVNTDLYNASKLKAQQKYKDGLAEINKLTRTDIDAINEKYNLQGLIRKVEGDGSGKTKLVEKETKEELIIQKHALDEIRQLDIDAMTDERGRREQQAIFNRDKILSQIELENMITDQKLKVEEKNYGISLDLAEKNSKKTTAGAKQLSIDLGKIETDHLQKIAKIKAENIPKSEQDELIRLSTIKANNELLAIDKEFYDKQNELNKINAQKTQSARLKIQDDNAKAEIEILEKDYNERQKKLDGFDLQEINNKERAISAKKVALIQAHADEKKAITDNEAEKLAIQNEANIAIEKESVAAQDKIKANQKIALNQALEFEQQLIDAVAKAEAEKSRKRIEGYDNQLKDADQNIATQRRLAEKGAKNTLAEEEANKIKIQQEKEKEKQAEIKRQKALAFFKLFASYAEKDPNTALQKALRDTVLAEAVSAAFIDGTENVGKDKQFAKNKFSNDQDGYIAKFDGDERILNPEQNKKIGNLSNEALADLAYKSNNGLLDNVKYAVVQNTDFAKNVHDSALLHQMANMNKEIQTLQTIIKDRPTSNYSFNGYEFVTETIANNNKSVKRQILKRPRI